MMVLLAIVALRVNWRSSRVLAMAIRAKVTPRITMTARTKFRTVVVVSFFISSVLNLTNQPRMSTVFQLQKDCLSRATAHFIPMKIHFFGAARTTTGSMYLLEVNGKKLLLECGLFQGHREESINRNCCFPFDPKQVDAVVLSHAHMDHAGNLPNLVKQGYTGNIHCTFATRDLCSIMLVDSAHIQMDDAAFVSKQRAKKHQPPVEPLYTITDAEKTLHQFVAVSYERPLQIVDGVTVTFRDAGHILGSAQVILDVREGNRKFRFLFSGDVGLSLIHISEH